MEKEQAIWERLERIDGLREDDAPAGILLDEVRALLAEAEEWVREEPDAPRRAAAALDRSKAALAAGERQTRQAASGSLTQNRSKSRRILFGAGNFLHNGCVQDCTTTGRSGGT